jgi:N-acetylmuramoyl-L-alanine amidase
MDDMQKLFIICGHGAGDPGAIGNGYNEAERVRTLAAKIKELGGDNVIIGDTTKNWYKSKMVNNTNIPKGCLVLELHTDSNITTNAKGAHVIIDANLNADKYDEALANFISGMFPGRSQKLIKRNDLANPNRAQAAGINYRLMECGFISNAGDMKIFNSKMDEIAKGILKCFDIGVINKPAEEPVTNGKMYRVQVGAFSVKSRAERLMNELKAKGYDAFVKEE